MKIPHADGVSRQLPNLGRLVYPIQTITNNFRSGGRQLGAESVYNALTGTVVRVLREVMIRHTKNQRVGGAVALALPESDACTVWLDMTSHENVLYQMSLKLSEQSHRTIKSEAAHRSTLESKLIAVREACGQVYRDPDSGSMIGRTGYREAFKAMHTFLCDKKGKIFWYPVASMCTKVHQN